MLRPQATGTSCEDTCRLTSAKRLCCSEQIQSIMQMPAAVNPCSAAHRTVTGLHPALRAARRVASTAMPDVHVHRLFVGDVSSGKLSYFLPGLRLDSNFRAQQCADAAADIAVGPCNDAC